MLLGLSQHAAATVTAGVAHEEFLLPARVPLAGYSRRKGKPSTGSHDPVGVRALVLREGPTAVALVSGDLLIIDERLEAAVRARLAASGVPAHTLLLAATHTHSGPGAYGSKFLEKISMGHYDPVVFDALVAAITGAVRRAFEVQQPLTMACGAGRTQGLVKNRISEGGFADAEAPVCAVAPPGGAPPEALVVNFAAHPTTLGAWNMALSADYPGAARQALERRWPGITVLFFAGAVGDQAPVKSGDGFGRAEFVGGPLAQAVEEAAARTPPVVPTGLQAAQERLPLPPARVRLSRRLRLPRWIGGRLVDDDATLTVIRLGRTVWFGVPCDLSSSLGRQLKEAAAARGLFPIVVGFANDYIGYCMPAAAYQAGEYEALMAFNGPHAGELIVARLIEMLDTVAAPAEVRDR